MSKLTFSKSAGTIVLTDSRTEIVGVWKAHNDFASTSRGGCGQLGPGDGRTTMPT